MAINETPSETSFVSYFISFSFTFYSQLIETSLLLNIDTRLALAKAGTNKRAAMTTRGIASIERARRSTPT